MDDRAIEIRMRILAEVSAGAWVRAKREIDESGCSLDSREAWELFAEFAFVLYFLALQYIAQRVLEDQHSLLGELHGMFSTVAVTFYKHRAGDSRWASTSVFRATLDQRIQRFSQCESIDASGMFMPESVASSNSVFGQFFAQLPEPWRSRLASPVSLIAQRMYLSATATQLTETIDPLLDLATR